MERDALQECECRRSGEGKGSMGAVNVARTLDQGAAADLLNFQGDESRTGGDNVCNGVLRSDLVKPDLLGRNTVNRPLSNGNAPEKSKSVAFYFRFECALMQQSNDPGMIAPMHMRVMMVILLTVLMVLFMRMVVFMMMSGVPGFGLVVTGHAESPPRDASADSPFKATLRKVDGKRRECLLENSFFDAEVPECGHGHIAADSRKSINVKDFHGWETERKKVFPIFPQRSNFGDMNQRFLTELWFVNPTVPIPQHAPIRYCSNLGSLQCGGLVRRLCENQ